MSILIVLKFTKANSIIDKDNTLTEAEKSGYLGFAKTMQAYELHLALNLQYQNGIRVDVSDPNNLGAFVSYDEALSYIANLLDDANSDLDKGDFAVFSKIYFFSSTDFY